MNGRVGGTGGGGGSAEGRHETARIVARDLAPVVSELASLKGEIYRDLGSRPEHRALAHRLEAAHAAAEAALVEARRRVRQDEKR
jgi:hypothetical protein